MTSERPSDYEWEKEYKELMMDEGGKRKESDKETDRRKKLSDTQTVRQK